ncbi:type II secretion system protein [Noviherbaspirillum cavernae]|uniref:Type II secretion system protein n=2 Tax=Noviherbaspirillum cavernae TaxID=2320862 RepID=A0A418WYH5_9BURK|nr:type II secretion system protein [Noviherbaspirillum cavernae]
MSRIGHDRMRANGFTYLGVLILVAVMGLVSTASVQVGVILQRRAAEEELLSIGMEFRNALTSYANATPTGKTTYPQSLQDLLKDPRYPNPRRHLRKLYADPLTGKEEWGTIAAPDGTGIAGVYSLSNAVPIKIGNFPIPFQEFAGKNTYREWKFTAIQLMQGAMPAIPVQPRP